MPDKPDHHSQGQKDASEGTYHPGWGPLNLPIGDSAAATKEGQEQYDAGWKHGQSQKK